MAVIPPNLAHSKQALRSFCGTWQRGRSDHAMSELGQTLQYRIRKFPSATAQFAGILSLGIAVTPRAGSPVNCSTTSEARVGKASGASSLNLVSMYSEYARFSPASRAFTTNALDDCVNRCPIDVAYIDGFPFSRHTRNSFGRSIMIRAMPPPT